jgi:hypothetical protein
VVREGQSGNRSLNIGPADGLGLGRLVLRHVPALGELAVLNANDVGGDPGGGSPLPEKGPARS